MAFPTVVTTNTSTQTAGTSHTVNLPASLVAGNLLIVFFENEDVSTVTTPANWTLLKSLAETAGATSKVTIFYKFASGSEGTTLTVTTGSSIVTAHISYQISGATIPQVSAGTSSATGNADPDSLTPTGGAKDYLWIAIAGTRNYTTSGWPTNYTGSNLAKNITGALGGCAVAVGTRNLNATSDDPGTFTFSTNNFWEACTMAVPPSVKVFGNYPPFIRVGNGQSRNERAT